VLSCDLFFFHLLLCLLLAFFFHILLAILLALAAAFLLSSASPFAS